MIYSASKNVITACICSLVLLEMFPQSEFVGVREMTGTGVKYGFFQILHSGWTAVRAFHYQSLICEARSGILGNFNFHLSYD